MEARERGRAAERLVRELLVEHGLEALHANWSRRLGEIDLVMREPSDGTVVFVEVRYRAGASPDSAIESVDAAKRSRLRRAALAWLQRHGAPDAPARIDVVAVSPEPESVRRIRSTGDPSARDGTHDGTGSDECPRPASEGDTGRAARPERLLVRREGQRVEWIVSAVEEDG